MEIDHGAPVTAEASVQVASDPGIVWDVIADVERWPAWNPDVKEASLGGPVNEGTEFRWKAGPGTIKSKLEAADRPHMIGWTGKTMGIGAVHVWRFKPIDGGTLATSAESWAGLLPRLLRGPMERQLQKSLEGSLPHLKAEAERRAAAR
jgi:uncharacterized protein YndB with AHSA1/START domain